MATPTTSSSSITTERFHGKTRRGGLSGKELVPPMQSATLSRMAREWGMRLSAPWVVRVVSRGSRFSSPDPGNGGSNHGFRGLTRIGRAWAATRVHPAGERAGVLRSPVTLSIGAIRVIRGSGELRLLGLQSHRRQAALRAPGVRIVAKEWRQGNRLCIRQGSDFGLCLRIYFGFRPSDFGFRIWFWLRQFRAALLR